MIEKILSKVFNYKKDERVLFLLDKLKNETIDSDFRFKLTEEWHKKIKNSEIAKYDATYANNADLPVTCSLGKFDEILSMFDIVIALNEFSATAPLHKYSKKYNLRVASMPGFNEDMIKALEIDIGVIKNDVDKLYDLLHKSNKVKIIFTVDNKDLSLLVDLGDKKPLKDDGDCTKPGVINLPTGEAFISPLEGQKSRTKGFLPIQFGNDVKIYGIDKNSIVACINDSSDKLMNKIKEDSAIGNIAEIAFGVLKKHGIKHCGKILLDEKLGFHIALGRSDHFGGETGVKSFKLKENVWHQDYVYVPQIQPKISLKEVRLIGTEDILVIKDNKNLII
jgi:leucyl aminopeptidase (aminopeptidase T)